MAITLLLLAGCSAGGDAKPESTVTPWVAPTPEEATPEQVASVLAEYETDWRDVIDGAIDCRFTWTVDDTPTGQLQGTTCFTTEKTIGITSQLAVREWGEMEIPSSMQDLVASTSKVLGLISETDLAAVCGEDSEPNGTQECNDALGSRNFAYSMLEGELDKWKPYL
ncbi:hypothetical protein MicroSTF_16170 [Microbacterium sp. STF-2]|uniref:hypothetical protein n=1 Tax=Microbacterium sp. STF-2 TaxID=3031132 RepID=UPI002AFE3DD3|nr:hypothetical protein [Microbacterium sp. STF-2]MEA1264581.1 hypothetical protein [Microbacterium sp. STF-2]